MTTTKFFAVCESGSTDADVVRQFPDSETAQMFCDIWMAAHPGTSAYVRNTRRMEHHELGTARMTVETY